MFRDSCMLPVRHKSEKFSSQNRHAADCGAMLSSPETTGVCAATTQASTSNDFSQQVSGTNQASQNMLQFAKMRKLSDERADPRKLVSTLL